MTTGLAGLGTGWKGVVTPKQRYPKKLNQDVVSFASVRDRNVMLLQVATSAPKKGSVGSCALVSKELLSNKITDLLLSTTAVRYAQELADGGGAVRQRFGPIHGAYEWRSSALKRKG